MNINNTCCQTLSQLQKPIIKPENRDIKKKMLINGCQKDLVWKFIFAKWIQKKIKTHERTKAKNIIRF